MPFLTLGQSDFNDKISADKYLPAKIVSEKLLIWKDYTDSDKHIETTLINDTKYYKSTLNFDLATSINLSITINFDKKTNWIDEQKLDEMLLEVNPLIDSKNQFKKPIETKSLFKNYERNN